MEPIDQIASLDNVTRVYERGLVTALCDVTLSISRGESLAIMGPSGSGKSTLLHLLCGLDRPTTGRVIFEGREPGTLEAWARIRARRIGFVFQMFNLLPTLTSHENIELAMLGVVPGATERRVRTARLLDRVGLSSRRNHHPAELSGGERQRVAIARALANDPAIILADEPTGNLDSKTSLQIMDLLMDINHSGKTTLVLVTHDPGVAARAGRRLTMVDGRLVDEQTKTLD